MSDDKDTRLHPLHAPKVNSNPLQQPGKDELIRRSTMMGPDDPGDRWFFLDTGTLRELLKVAEASPMMQARVPRCGLQVDLYRRRDGSQYEVWRVIGGKPSAVPLPPVAEALMKGGVFDV